jgi:hypothetical protein
MLPCASLLITPFVICPRHPPPHRAEPPLPRFFSARPPPDLLSGGKPASEIWDGGLKAMVDEASWRGADVILMVGRAGLCRAGCPGRVDGSAWAGAARFP